MRDRTTKQWIHPNSDIKNKIYYVLTRKKVIIKNTKVSNMCTIGSDHRQVRAKININIKMDSISRLKNSRSKQNG